jgi:hypothetical protein
MKLGRARKPKSYMISFRIDYDDLTRLSTFAQQTSCSPAVRLLHRQARGRHRSEEGREH